MIRMRKHGYLRRERPTPNELPQYSVVESILPPGVVTYTGVKQAIPLEPEPEPEPTPPEPTEDKAGEATIAFLEAELRSIKVQTCRIASASIYNPGGYTLLKDVTLWDVCQLGLAMQNTLGTKFEKEIKDEQAAVEQQTQQADSVDDTEETEEHQSTVETGAPF